MLKDINGARDFPSYQIFFAINDWHTSIWTVKTLNYDSVFGDILQKHWEIIMYFLGITAIGYGNRKKILSKNRIENSSDIKYFKTIGRYFDIEDYGFKYYYINYLFLIYNVCAHTHVCSSWNFREVVSMDEQAYIDFSLESLYFDVL
jgi:hypothetical protein